MNQTVTSPAEEIVLRASALTKIYGENDMRVTALQGVNMHAGKGEFLAVMGPSGSGKSTLLYLLGGLDYPTSGRILLEGKDLGALNDKELTLVRRRRIGFLFQAYNLVSTLTAEENIALPFIISNASPKTYRSDVEDLLKLVKLESRRGHRPDQLSGGEQQRIALARALAIKPAVLLADEPTGNLDTKTGREILELLRTAAREAGQTIVMVTHDPKAASYADRVTFLKDGSIFKTLELKFAGEEKQAGEKESEGEPLEAIIASLKELES